jgi:hypothetical protein
MATFPVAAHIILLYSVSAEIQNAVLLGGMKKVFLQSEALAQKDLTIK